jgi:ABC-2 type transport system permease protein
MSSIAAATTRDTAQSNSTVPFTATLTSEWAKLVTMRSTWTTLALAAIMSIGITALFSWVTGWTWDDLTAADQAKFNPIELSFIGGAFSGILLAVLGVSIVTSEYSSGMMRLTMTVTPNRGRIVLAKALIIAAVAIVAGLMISVANFLVAQAIFDASNLTTASLGDSDAFRAIVVGAVVTGPVFPLLGVAIAFIFRSTALAITTVLALIFLPSFFGGLLPRGLQEDVLAWLPGQAADSFAIGHLYPDDPMYLDSTVGLIVAAAWTIGSLVAATIVLNRRDV